MKANRIVTTHGIIPALHDTAAEAGPHQGFTFLSESGKASTFLSFAELAQHAARLAGAFQDCGAGPGDRVILLVSDQRDFVLAMLGALHAGLVPVPAAPPFSIGALPAYIGHLRRIVEKSGSVVLVCSHEMEPLLGSLAKAPIRRIVSFEKLELHSEQAPVPRRKQDLALIQFTSGSTSDPKGVALTHEMLLTNVHCILAMGLRTTPADIGCSWLPLFHDMGLIGFVIGPLVASISVVFIPPLLFLKRPVEWLKAITRARATITFAPNFAYGMCIKRIRDEDLASLDLSSLRVVGCGAEPIQPELLESFAERFATAGFKRRAFLPCYGRAESTLAVTFAHVEDELRSLTLSRSALEAGRAVLARPAEANAVRLVSCGRPFLGHELHVARESGEVCDEMEIGEILTRGPSVMSGYFQDAANTAATLKDGWLYTGDLGFISKGELYVCGRKKDLIIIAGKNYYPNDIEWTVSQITPVRSGSVAAFSVTDGTLGLEKVVVCAEFRGNSAGAAEIEHAIKEVVLEAIGLAISIVVLLPAGSVPKTSSGKIRRSKTKQLYLTGQLGKSRPLASRLLVVGELLKSQLGRFGQWIKFDKRLSG